jgi:hypothetical protein
MDGDQQVLGDLPVARPLDQQDKAVPWQPAPLRQHRRLQGRRCAAPGAHRKAHRQQGRQQHHPQAVFNQHLGGHPRAAMLLQAALLRLDLGEQIGLRTGRPWR